MCVLQHSHEGIRKAAICAVATFCRLWYQWLREAGSTDLGMSFRRRNVFFERDGGESRNSE